MKTRTLFLLLGALLLLGLAALLAERAEQSKSPSSTATRLFPGFEPARATRIEIKTAAKSWSLEKREGAWKVAPGGFAADEQAVKDALEKLERTDKVELAAQNPEKHAALGVKEGEGEATAVKVWTGDAKPGEGKPAVDLLIGKEGADYSSSFVRLAGANDVYRTGDAVRTLFDRTQGWRDRTVMKLAPEDALRIELDSDAGRIVLERPEAKGTEGWTLVEPETGPANASTVDQILRSLSTLQAEDFPVVTDMSVTGLEPPTGRVLVKLKDGVSHELHWGGDVGSNGNVYARRTGAETIYSIAAFRRTQVFQKLESLRPPPPEPGAETAPAPAAAATPAASPSGG